MHSYFMIVSVSARCPSPSRSSLGRARTLGEETLSVTMGERTLGERTLAERTLAERTLAERTLNVTMGEWTLERTLGRARN
jgi:hypothetical protein